MYDKSEGLGSIKTDVIEYPKEKKTEQSTMYIAFQAPNLLEINKTHSLALKNSRN